MVAGTIVLTAVQRWSVNKMNKRYIDIDDVLELFGIEDEDLYATRTIEDALYDGTLKVYKLPSTERLGKWKDIEHAPDSLMYVTCSVCGKRQTVEFTSYCGNCGAKFRDEKRRAVCGTRLYCGVYAGGRVFHPFLLRFFGGRGLPFGSTLRWLCACPCGRGSIRARRGLRADLRDDAAG